MVEQVCRLCKRKGDEATLLLCDGCDLGYHMGCLRLGSREVPDGDWLCPSCKVIALLLQGYWLFIAPLEYPVEYLSSSWICEVDS